MLREIPVQVSDLTQKRRKMIPVYMEAYYRNLGKPDVIVYVGIVDLYIYTATLAVFIRINGWRSIFLRLGWEVNYADASLKRFVEDTLQPTAR